MGNYNNSSNGNNNNRQKNFPNIMETRINVASNAKLFDNESNITNENIVNSFQTFSFVDS